MEFFSNILASPSLVWIVTAMGFYLVNIFLGLFIAFQKNTVDTRKIHKWLFYSIAFCLVYFLIMNQTHHENTLIDYAVVLYMVALVPFSKRWDVLVHALIAVIGLILLPLLIVLQI
jgi:hypothetical protein